MINTTENTPAALMNRAAILASLGEDARGRFTDCVGEATEAAAGMFAWLGDAEGEGAMDHMMYDLQSAVEGVMLARVARRAA